MTVHSAKIRAGVIILSASILACTLLASPSVPSGDEPTPPSTAEPAVTVESTLPPAPSPAGMVEISELDPCKLVTKESAEMAMGQSVDEPILAQDAAVASCTYVAVPGEKMVMATVYAGENAKNYLLNDIAQLKNGCELSYGSSTNPEAPTPFPAEVEALRGQSILELFLQDLELQEGCGGSYSQVPELGKNAYTFRSIFVGSVIGVATEDAYVVFVVGDVGMTPEQALDAAIELVKRAAN
ncbi:MAG: hypothetical protein GXP40_00525 [Chloroflexi bacterium]|nr:hypothetical protein [Chloroflexota bacterium]